MTPEQYHAVLLLLGEIRDLLDYLCNETERLGLIAERGTSRADT